MWAFNDSPCDTILCYWWCEHFSIACVRASCVHFYRVHFFPTRQVRMSGSLIRFSNTLRGPLMHMALTGCRNCSYRTHPNHTTHFFPTHQGSSNVSESHRVSKCTESDIKCTWRGHGVIVVAIRHTRIQNFWEGKNFFHHGKFECLGVSTGWAIHLIWPHVRLALTGCHSCCNSAHPNPKFLRR